MKSKLLIAGVLFAASLIPGLSQASAHSPEGFTEVHSRYSPYYGKRYGYSKYYSPRSYRYYNPRRYFRYGYPKRRYHSNRYQNRYYR